MYAWNLITHNYVHISDGPIMLFLLHYLSTHYFHGTNELFQETAEQLTLVVLASQADSEYPSVLWG